MEIEIPEKRKLFDMDAWSDGQVRSKLWLSQQLEALLPANQPPMHIWIYGSWYGTLALFFLVRERIPIRRFQLFDLDAEAVARAKELLNYWHFDHKLDIDFHIQDCNELDFLAHAKSDRPDLVINTSCEHFTNHRWFQNLPADQMYLAQSNNMVLPSHINCAENLSAFAEQLTPAQKPMFADELSFRYTNFSFDRFMLIGKK